MSGSIKKDAKRGTYYFVVDTRTVNGKRRQVKRRGFRTKKLAQAALDDLRSEMVSGRESTRIGSPFNSSSTSVGCHTSKPTTS